MSSTRVPDFSFVIGRINCNPHIGFVPVAVCILILRHVVRFIAIGTLVACSNQAGEDPIELGPQIERGASSVLALSPNDNHIGLQLSSLVSQLDEHARGQLPSVRNIDVARFDLEAVKAELLPSIRPVVSSSLSDVSSPSVGLRAEQLIWGAGRVSSRISSSEIGVEVARATAWRDRNAEVQSGLSAIIDVARLGTRLDVLNEFDQQLDEIQRLLQYRLDGGIADRGELIRLRTARQELERRRASDTSDLVRSRSEVRRYLPNYHENLADVDLEAAAGQCTRLWPDSPAPEIVIAELELQRAVLNEQEVRASQFPRLVASAETRFTSGRWAEPEIGLSLDASGLVAFGRTSRVTSARAETERVRSSSDVTRVDVESHLQRLNAEYDGLLAEIASLQELYQESEASLLLYEEQLQVGSLTVADGVGLYREHFDTAISISDLFAEMVLNCVAVAASRGLLAARDM